MVISERPSMIILDDTELNFLFNNMHPMTYLKPFFTKARSLQEVSTELNIAMSSYHYWIKKFLKLGLLIVDYEKHRSGSNIKYYITPAEKIIIKLDKGYISQKEFYDAFTTKYDLNTMVTQHMLETLYFNNEDFGIMLHEDSQGEFYAKGITISNNEPKTYINDAMLEYDSPAVLAIWKDVRLKYSDAKELQRRLVDLLNEFDTRISPGQKTYLLQLALAPEN